MRLRAVRILPILLLSPGQFGSAHAAGTAYLYLISGTPTYPNVPVTLYRVDAQQKSTPTLVRPVADSAECVLVDYDHRTVVVGSPPVAPTVFSVINMDAPSEARAVQIPYDSQDMLPGGVFLLDLPGKGESVALVLGRLFKEPHIPFRDLTAVQLNSPENSPIKLPPSDIKYVRLSGKAGGALKGDQGVPNALTAASTLTLGVPNPQAWSLDLPRPPYDPDTYNIPLYVNNDSIAVLWATTNAIDIFDKTQKQWHRTNLPFPSTRVRAFGPWIAAIAEQSALLSIPPGRSVITAEELQKLRRGESPGKAQRQSEEIGYKLTVDDLFEDSHSTFPGGLFVYNGLTGASFQIATGQADSEVLFATDAAIFYRVNDELYRVDVEGTGLSPAVALAKDPAIFQVHWAFLAGSQGN